MLSAEDTAILDFERDWWQRPGPKDQAIEFDLGLTAASYYARLGSLVASQTAFDYDPLTIKRVRRVIENPVDGEVAV